MRKQALAASLLPICLAAIAATMFMVFSALPLNGQITPPSGGGGGGSGTVTSVGGACGISGGPITISGTLAQSELVNAQTGASYTILASDCGKLVTFANAGVVAVTVPTAGGSFANGFKFSARDSGAGSATLTPATGTIGGAATLVLTTGQGCDITSDGTNWQTQCGSGSGGSMPASANVVGTNSLGQLIASTAHMLSAPQTCVAASASGTAYTCSTLLTFAPAAGDQILFKADVANTGSATLNVNASSAAAIKKQGGTAPIVANDLAAGQWTSMVYDGTQWQMVGQVANAATGLASYSVLLSSALQTNGYTAVTPTGTYTSPLVLISTADELGRWIDYRIVL